MSVASYNSDKLKLQETITKIYQTINNPKDDTIQFDAIRDETKRLFEKQEVVFRMVSTLAVVAIIVTVYRVS